MSSTELAVRSEQPGYLVEFDRDKINLLKDTVAKGATDNELALFIEVCRRKNLDPFSKQIHMVKRWDATLGREVASFQIGIDGFRAQAERTGLYEGQVGPYWCGADGSWRDVWLDTAPPAAAKVGVYRRGFREPVWGIALWREYVQTSKDKQTQQHRPNAMWSKMGTNQLAKCAEALALRKAFPEELAGTYTPDEMAQADSIERTEAKHAQSEVLEARLAEAQRYKESNQIDDSDVPTVMGGSFEPAEPERNRVEELRERQRLHTVEGTAQPVDPGVTTLWKRMAEGKFEALAVFQELKAAFITICGSKEEGTTEYYAIVNKHGAEKSDGFKTKGIARAAAQDMYERLLQLKQQQVNVR